MRRDEIEILSNSTHTTILKFLTMLCSVLHSTSIMWLMIKPFSLPLHKWHYSHHFILGESLPKLIPNFFAISTLHTISFLLRICPCLYSFSPILFSHQCLFCVFHPLLHFVTFIHCADITNSAEQKGPNAISPLRHLSTYTTMQPKFLAHHSVRLYMIYPAMCNGPCTINPSTTTTAVPP